MQAPQSLLKYESSVKVYQSTKDYHQGGESINYDPDIPPRQEEIIDSILPPRDWTDHNNKLHIQYVSHQPATRQTVLELTKTLQQSLSERQARPSGICGIREELYSQAFDQIIRQVAIDCPERGLLLMRVRDQRKMTIAAYETVFQAGVSYGLQKIFQNQGESQQGEEQVLNLQKQKQELIRKKFMLLCQKDLLDKEIREKSLYIKQSRAQQIKFLKLQEQNMVKFLQAVKLQREGK